MLKNSSRLGRLCALPKPCDSSDTPNKSDVFRAGKTPPIVKRKNPAVITMTGHNLVAPPSRGISPGENDKPHWMTSAASHNRRPAESTPKKLDARFKISFARFSPQFSAPGGESPSAHPEVTPPATLSSMAACSPATEQTRPHNPVAMSPVAPFPDSFRLQPSGTTPSEPQQPFPQPNTATRFCCFCPWLHPHVT